MTTKDIDIIAGRIDTSLSAGRYSEALGELETLIASSVAPWEIRREMAKLKENYELVKRFALDGYKDPSRESMLSEIARGIRRQASLIRRAYEMTDSPSVYYSALRYENMQSDDTVPSLIDSYMKLVNAFSMSRYGFSAPEKSGGVEHREIEEAEKRLFNRVWVTFPLTDADKSAISKFLTSEAVAESAKLLVADALLLGGLHAFDESRIDLLVQGYESAETRLSIHCLCSMLLLLWRWRAESLSEQLSSRISLLEDEDSFAADVRMASMQFIRTMDTARVTRHVNEDLIPKMRNISPDLKKLSEMQEMAFDSSLEENPQWNELMRKSGLEEDLKKLNDMQLEGADVMMSTFSHLKSFPFFNDVHNWFRTFDPDLSVLKSVSSGSSELIELLGHTPFLCDNDKYSLAFSLGNLPPDMIKMVRGQLEGKNIDFAEIATAYADKERSNEANTFMQNLYRFFNLYRRKGDFFNPFAAGISLFDVPVLATVLDDNETRETTAEFYLRHGYFAEAIKIYNRIPEEEIFLSDQLLQKIGYCYQKLGQYESAIDAYSKSELIDGTNRWTLRRLAYCHKALGHTDAALSYFERLLKMIPDDINLLLNAGHCKMEQGRYSEALNLYFKVEFIDEKTTKTLRPIAWCALLSGDMKRADAYFSRIMSDPNTTDRLNYGHYLLAAGKPREAVDSYRKALKEFGDFHKFVSAFEADRPYFGRMGIDPLLITLVIDEVWNTDIT